MEDNLRQAVGQNHGFGGGVLRLQSSEDGILWQGASGTDITPESTFEVGSITKVFTATIVFMLMENGTLTLTLDKPLAGFVEALPSGKLQSAVERLTLRLLLNHRSGLPDFWDDEQFEEAFAGGADREWSISDLVGYIDEGSFKLAFNPGTRFQYNDTGYLILCMVIEQVTGKTFSEVLDSLIIGPLGLQNTYMSFGARGYPDSHRYEKDLDISVCQRQTADTHASGGLISNAADLSVFMHSLAECKLVSSSSLADMTDWQETSDEDISYGLGLYCIDMTEVDMGQVWGHDGHGNSFMYFFEKFGIAVTGTLNQQEYNQEWWDNLVEGVLVEVNETMTEQHYEQWDASAFKKASS
jgi:CubicO group peptidase (beta-lactamase class C family)